MKNQTNIKPNHNTTTFEDLSVSTQTVMAYMNCEFFIKPLAIQLHKLFNRHKNITEFNGKIISLKAPKQFYEQEETINENHVEFNSNSKNIKKKKHFRNQLTVKMLIYEKVITIKIFRTGKFHMTGCKSEHHRKLGALLLLQTIMSLSQENYKTYQMKPGHYTPEIILEIVMINVDFNIDFPIDQIALDTKIQELNDPQFYSIYDACINTSVNIKMEFKEPKKLTYEKIIIHDEKNIEYTKTEKCPDAKPKETRTHTFLVFSSSKVIQSGRYYNEHMSTAYNKFINFIYQNREQIELKENYKPFNLNTLNCFNKQITF